jgi:hypothetical protein
MNKLLLIILSIFFLIIIIWYIVKINTKEFFIQENEGQYNNIFTVKNVDDLRKYFVIDNPLEDGVDPTEGVVDYSYAMPKDKDGVVIPNVNGDRSWVEIPKTGNINEIVTNYSDGIKINLSKNLVTKGLYPKVFNDSCHLKNKVGTVRLSSRKLFKGGLFVFDIEHVPIGCGLWPAIWMNGFVGLPDQYHAKEGTPLFLEGIKKLKESTISCVNKKNTLDPHQSLDKFMSKYVGKNVYQAQWPVGGEFDIVEQTQFSPTNLMSIHGGPNCEVKAEYKMDNSEYLDPFISDFHRNMQYRSTCGETLDRNAGYDHFSGCMTPENRVKVGCNVQVARSCPTEAGLFSGNTQIVGPYGSFGVPFNETGGGVYVTQWVPNKKVFMWFFPRTDFSKEELSKDGMPLSKNPKPEIWEPTQKNKKVLLMSYRLDDPNALTSGCDFNFQAIIMNITVGGGWGGNTVPPYCKYDIYNCNIPIIKPYISDGPDPEGRSRPGADGRTIPHLKDSLSIKEKIPVIKTDEIDPNKSYEYFGNYSLKNVNISGCGYNSNGPINYSDFLEKCYNANPLDTDSKGVGLNGCYDGAFNKDARGKEAKPVFFSEAYFKIRSINVFQRNNEDKNVW